MSDIHKHNNNIRNHIHAHGNLICDRIWEKVYYGAHNNFSV